jgi:hypothetical protein
MRGWKALLAVAILGGTGALMTTPLPSRAWVFVQEFEKSSASSGQVGFWERVVYSLIEANNRGADCRAPRILRSGLA